LRRSEAERGWLDGLRGIAVLLVICVHVGVLTRGYIGVDIFFAPLLRALGFLITSSLYEEWDRTGGISLRCFYERRARVQQWRTSSPRVRSTRARLYIATSSFALSATTSKPRRYCLATCARVSIVAIQAVAGDELHAWPSPPKAAAFRLAKRRNATCATRE
jgi:hypothetical protein